MFGKNDKEPAPDLEIFVAYDSKVDAYSEIMPATNRHALIREFLNTFRDPRHSQSKYLVNAEDYSLFKIGTYTFKTGKLTSQPPEHCANIHELRTLVEMERSKNAQQVQETGPRALSST